jgi:membrane protein implicated in regulation of membrane protease activity
MDQLKLWAGIAVAVVALLLGWMLFGSIVWTIIKWGALAFILLWVFGTWMPNYLKRRNGDG